MTDDRVIKEAEVLWNYHRMGMKPDNCDIIFILGSHDLRVADYGADLFLRDLAPWLVISGGIAHAGDLLETGWDKSEAETFARRAVSLGVPKEKIVLECRASNTGENVLFSEKILKERGIRYDSILALQKPYMERRTFATLKKHWPEKELIVSSPRLSFSEYPNEEVSPESLISLMVGDLQRIIEYPARGYQIYQNVPDDVLYSYRYLINQGFDAHLI